VNTIEKMADKRALVAATLLATGCSDIFTQDMEEDKEPAPEDSSAKTATEPPSRPVPRPQPAAPPRKPPVPPPAPPAHPEPELPPEGTGPSPAQRKQLFALADELQMDERARHQFGEIQFRKPSSKTWTKDEVSRAIDVLSRRLDARNAQEAAQ
jgi:type IV secretory pathway VirB10-like protein